MAITKKKNKFTVPKEYRTSIFAKGGNLYLNGGLGIPMTGVNVTGGPDMSKILAGAPAKFTSANPGGAASSGLSAAGMSGALGVAQGALQLGTQMAGNLDTSMIGKEVRGTNDISRGDILNTNVNVDSNQSNGWGEAGKGALTGAQAGMAFGPWGAAIGGGVGALAGGLTSIFGNEAKEDKALTAEKQWTSNLEAKSRQFNQQDLRQNMANYSAFGGDLNTYAYGGNIQSPLQQFNTGGTHEENPQGGIQQGTGANGQPNLVEQGETKHENYIFSDRLKVNPKISGEFKLPKGLNGKTFAQASKYLNREAKDRPNDPISNNGVKAHLAKLTAAQEGLKEQMQPQQQGIPMEGQLDANMLAQGYANGGNLYGNGGFENAMESYINPTTTAGILSKTALQIADPTGVSSYPDVYASGREMYNNPSLSNLGDLGFQTLGALPMLGKVTAAAKVAKTADKIADAQKALKTVSKLNKKIDTIGELIPGVKTITGKVQDFTTKNITQPIFNSRKTSGIGSLLKAERLNKYNQGIDILNTTNTFQDMTGVAPLTDNNNFRLYANGGYIDQTHYQNPTLQGANIGAEGMDLSRYAPVGANIAMGISDMFEKPEQVKFGRVSPERVTSRMDYQPVDTEWMTNKMNSAFAGTRDQMINNAGGNRAAAMAGLSSINQQQQNAMGEAYLKGQDINYGRKQAATQFNAGIETQNVAAQNAAQQANLQLQMQEMDANARNRAAKRNAARAAIMQSATTLGDIGRENFNANTVKSSTGYGYNNDGSLAFNVKEGTIHGNQIYKKGQWVAR